METTERQRILDEDHLRLLRIGYFVVGGINLLFALMPLLYFFIGGLLATLGPEHHGDDPGPRFFGFILMMFGLGFFVLILALAALKLATAWALGQRRWYVLCFITAILTCLSIPYGTALGILTLIVLCRPSVKALFQRRAAAGQNLAVTANP